jgi:hypothetical protein
MARQTLGARNNRLVAENIGLAVEIERLNALVKDDSEVISDMQKSNDDICRMTKEANHRARKYKAQRDDLTKIIRNKTNANTKLENEVMGLIIKSDTLAKTILNIVKVMKNE